MEMTPPPAPAAPAVPAADPHPWLGHIEILISVVLRVGVLTSLFVIVVGTVLSFARHPRYLTSPADLTSLTKPGAAFPHSIRQVAEGVEHGQGRAVVVAGLLLLIATPVVRVAISVASFTVERDWPFVVITLVVLCLLIVSFFLGKAGG
jgi:uncharacterized membrane protein